MLLILLCSGFYVVPGNETVRESGNELLRRLAHVINPSELTTHRKIGKPTPDITAEEIALGNVASTKITQHFQSNNIQFPIVYLFNEKGLLYQKDFPSENEKVEIVYDAQGNKIRDKMNTYEVVYEYNEQGLLKKYQTRNMLYTFEYKDNIEIRKGYNNSNVLVEEKECRFNHDSLLVHTIRKKYDSNNSVDVYESTHEYDDKANVLKTTYLRTLNGEEKHRSDVRYEYNKLGFVTAELYSDSRKNIRFTYTINDKDKTGVVIIRKAITESDTIEDKFSFDNNGNWILREEKRNGELEVKHTREIVYRK